MDTLEDSENNAKISDSAYSNSCSNSQSRRSHSSKSTHSGSNSSGSSGYGGKPSSTSSNNLDQSPKKDKEVKKKKTPLKDTLNTEANVVEAETLLPEPTPVFEAPNEESQEVVKTPSPTQVQPDNAVEDMEQCVIDSVNAADEVPGLLTVPATVANYIPLKSYNSDGSDGFSCVVSMHDGVVMYATASLSATLGFPKDMWIGRSFIDFVHARDRATFASQITNGLAVPNVNGTQQEVPTPVNLVSTMVCRMRKYRGLATGFGVKERNISYMPVLLKLTFKKVEEDDGKITYLIIQATPFLSAFKTANEIVSEAAPFVMRHAANCRIDSIEHESVPYLGYLPQDLAQQDALMLYHPDDLVYLRQVYETIVKEGGLARCKPYRMKTQNGGYVKLETEWSSFINPWSKKLEFVIGKHHILEGPKNPDVFGNVDEKPFSVPETERIKTQKLRDAIFRILNEVLTKPAEAAKQLMGKRCQDLASYMESLMEEHPCLTQPDEELRVEVQDAENSYYERDSVMLGGISPHHEYDNSQSSTETPLSYNQLNYKETLQRYFDNHQPLSFEDYSRLSGENVKYHRRIHTSVSSQCLSPMAPNSGVDSGDVSSSCESNFIVIGSPNPEAPVGDYQKQRLTESLILKHNQEMEKELMKMQRESRSSNKSERERVSHETRQKKIEHLARCNIVYESTSALHAPIENQPHGIKRSSKPVESDMRARKHHCPSPRVSRRRSKTLYTSAAPVYPSATITTTMAAQQYPTTVLGHINTFYMGYPPQMPIVQHTVAGMPGMYPMFYTPLPSQPIPSSSNSSTAYEQHQHLHHHAFQQAPMPCMVYGHPMYGHPIPMMYTPFGAPYPGQANPPVLTQARQPNCVRYPIELARQNYEQTLDTVPRPRSPNRSVGKLSGAENTEDNIDKTDGESSYSSFYSSFFKTESGSAEDSGDARNVCRKDSGDGSALSNGHYKLQHIKNIAKRKMDPPWMDQVCVTPELVYKYKIVTKSLEEVLAADKLKLAKLEQPELVNDQLGQLYVDLQLEGVTSRLTLEEGVTSSSSSGEETSSSKRQYTVFRKKRQYNKLVMIYEEDAPLPPPPDTEAIVSSQSS